MKSSRMILFFGAFLCFASTSVFSGDVTEGVAPQPAPKIQIALLLDTSGSMNGLINQAKTQLWKIVNEFVTAKQKGARPTFEVALYEYGNDNLNAQQGFIRQVISLTNDLDKVSQELFALKTNGGSEFCGWVIREASNNLAWSAKHNDLKVIIIAGNEAFTQGTVNYKESCKAAISKGIVVNTIFCGTREEGIQTMWQDGATRADGAYMNINQNQEVVQIAAPQDAEIARLGVEINDTYIAYGDKGLTAKENQIAQDANAATAAPLSAVQRAITKSSAIYQTSDWDLVDAVKNNNVKLEEVKLNEMPVEMQKMSPDERKAYLEEKAKLRAKIQAKIQELDKQRKEYVSAEMKKQAEVAAGPGTVAIPADTLDSAMSKAIIEQAAKAGFQFEK
ncbi:MAG: vWA domain-containing protein [Planctomycetota bacterium]